MVLRRLVRVASWPPGSECRGGGRRDKSVQADTTRRDVDDAWTFELRRPGGGANRGAPAIMTRREIWLPCRRRNMRGLLRRHRDMMVLLGLDDPRGSALSSPHPSRPRN